MKIKIKYKVNSKIDLIFIFWGIEKYDIMPTDSTYIEQLKISLSELNP